MNGDGDGVPMTHVKQNIIISKLNLRRNKR